MRSTKAGKRRTATASTTPAGRSGRIGVRLQYAFDTSGQDGDALDNPVMEILTAVVDGGSIRHAAQRLGKSYRHVWGTLRHWERAFGAPLVTWSQGQRARLTPFAEQLLLSEQRARMRARPLIEKLRADLADGLREDRRDRSTTLSLHASHDLALPVLSQFLMEHAGPQLDLRILGSFNAIQSLRDRRCLLAGFHVPSLGTAMPAFRRVLQPLLNSALHRILPCSQRVQGLMMRKEHASRVRTIGDVVAQRLRFVNRQVGSGTRLLIDHLMDSESVDSAAVDGFARHVESSHLSAAVCIAGGVADVGIGLEAAALHYGLHFEPLVKENYYLACHVDDCDRPGVQQLQQALSGPIWRGILSNLPGYGAGERSGELCDVDSLFPWLNECEALST